MSDKEINDRNWRIVLVSLMGMVAMLLTFAGGVSFTSYQAANREARDREAESNAADAREQIYSECIRLPGALPAVCAANAEDADKRAERPDNGLKAQQDAAEWALGTLWLSLFALVFNGAGLVYVVLSLQATRISARAAAHSADVQARAERPYLVPRLALDPSIQGGRLMVLGLGPVFENTGKLPARQVSTRSASRFLQGPIPADFDFEAATMAAHEMAQIDYGPGATEMGEKHWLVPDSLDDLVSGRLHLYLFGGADYRDPLFPDEVRKVRYCWKILYSASAKPLPIEMRTVTTFNYYT